MEEVVQRALFYCRVGRGRVQSMPGPGQLGKAVFRGIPGCASWCDVTDVCMCTDKERYSEIK